MKKYVVWLVLVMALVLGGCSGKKQEASDITCVDDLVGKKIGVQMGTTGAIYAADYEEDGVTVVERYNKGADAISSLKNGKVDCVIIDGEPAKSFVSKNSELSILDEDFALEEYAICVSKKNPELTEMINASLRKLKKDGTVDKIINHYINDPEDGYEYVSPEGLDYANGELVMATNVAFPPYEYYVDSVPTGIDVDIAKAIADDLNMKLIINDIDFDAIITAVQSGKADIGVAGMTVTEDRLKNIDFTDTYATARQVIVVRNGEESSSGSLKDKFYQSFVEDNRYQYLLKGLGNTLIISVFSCVMGIVIGFVIAIIRATYDKTGKMKFLNMLCKVYLTVIRGTPTMVQLLIIYYVVFATVDINKVIVAILAFGINSGAYVAEIIRGGIMAIDNGQFEGARSLGLSHFQTMVYVILPQTFKNTLPSLGNEFIVLIKETSISGYIGLHDVTRGGDIIRGATFEAFLPLITVAIIYLIIVMILTAGVSKLERSLKKNER